ncbi:hypothetical protein TIFTF001_047505 [Ficus carica]|uniref:DUF1985 domain-containing protein n=1 Tax=Ficus carica TaxID=3494 RepID=A0AA88CN27_FICCA|nr:hypothetical protein TIFTF001_047505 [Ficus carica]
MSKPTKMSEKNTTPERRSVRVTASAYKRPSAEESSKKPAPEIERMVSDERLKRKQGEIKVEDSKKLISAVEEKISEAEEVFHNIVMQLTDHSGMDDALWFEVGEDLGRFSINEFCLITGMKCVGSTHLPPVVESRLITRYFLTLRGVSRENLELQMSNANFDNDNDAVKLSLLYMIFCIPLSNANSVKIDLKFFALADNLDNFNDFPWGVLSWEATRAAICNTVENKMSSKRRRPLKKSDKVHYSIAGFPHALLVWAYETLPSIAAKFTTKYDQAIPRMLSWITADNVKSDDVMSAFIAVGENQPKCFVIMPTEEELKDPWVAQLYLKNPKVLPQLSPKTSVPRPSSDTNSEWREFQKEIRGQVDSMNKKLEDLKKEQKKFIKLLRRVLKLLSDNMNENGKGKAHTAYHVSSRQKTNVQTDESIALKTTSNDIGTGSQDDVFIDSDIGTVADMGVQAAMEFLTADKVIVSHEDVEEEKNKMIVCQHCGDKGFEEALTLCKKCGLYALHRYCLEVLPEDLSEDMIWSGFKKNEKVVTASEAKTKVQTDEREPSGYEPRCREKCDEIQMLRRKRRFVLEDEEDQCLKTSLVAVSNDKASNVVEQRVTTGSEVKMEGQMCEDGSFSNGS